MLRSFWFGLLFLTVFTVKAESDYQAGLTFLKQPRYDLAYRAFEKAVVTLNHEPLSTDYVSAMIRAGELDVLFAYTSKAIKRLTATREIILKRFPARKDLLADCLDQLGSAYEATDDVESAVVYYRQAIALKTAWYGMTDARTGYSYIKLTKYYSFRQWQDSANYYSRLAYRICERDTLHQDLVNMGEVYVGFAYEWKNCQPMEIENYDSLYQKVRRFYYTSLDYLHGKFPLPTIEEARIYQGLANSYADFLGGNFKQNPEKAERYFRSACDYYLKSLTLKKKLLGDSHPQVATTYYTLALLHTHHPGREYEDKGLYYYQRAIESVTDGYRLSGGYDLPPMDRVRFPYYLNVLLTNKVVLLEELYQETKDTIYVRVIHEHNRYRIRLWDEIIRTFESSETARIIRVWNGTPFENAVESALCMFELTGDSAYWYETFPIVERGRNNEFLELVIRAGKFRQPQAGHPANPIIPLKQFQQYLRSTQSVFLEFLPKPWGERTGNCALFITPDSFRVTTLCEAKRTDSLTASLLEAMYQGDATRYEEVGVRLYDELVRKTTGTLGGRLIISSTGDLSRIPFEALPVKTTGAATKDFRKLDYLMNHTEVTYALSATVLERQQRDRASSKGAICVYAPDFRRLSELPFSKRLVNELKSQWEGDFHVGAKALKSKFKQGVGEVSVLHLATHAESDLDHPERSALYFAGADDDSLLLDELFGMRIPVELTVLSTCESAQGRMIYGEGLKSFSRVFAHAGSKSTISTLWKVDDRATADVLRRFYGYLGEGQGKGVALRRAKQDYLSACRSSESANPFYWSGLILTGDPSPIRLEKNREWWYWFAVSGAVLVLIFVGIHFLRKK